MTNNNHVEETQPGSEEKKAVDPAVEESTQATLADTQGETNETPQPLEDATQKDEVEVAEATQESAESSAGEGEQEKHQKCYQKYYIRSVSTYQINHSPRSSSGVNPLL